MLRSGDFWIGVVGGMVGLYAYHYWQARKAAQN